MEACKKTLSKQIHYTNNCTHMILNLFKLEITAAACAFRGQATPKGLLLKTWLHFQETVYESRVGTSLEVKFRMFTLLWSSKRPRVFLLSVL